MTFDGQRILEFLAYGLVYLLSGLGLICAETERKSYLEHERARDAKLAEHKFEDGSGSKFETNKGPQIVAHFRSGMNMAI